MNIHWPCYWVIHVYVVFNFCDSINVIFFNRCLSPLMLWVWILLLRGVLNTTLCDKVCQWLAASLWFSQDTMVSSTNKTHCHDIVEILLKVALNTKTLTLILPYLNLRVYTGILLIVYTCTCNVHLVKFLKSLASLLYHHNDKFWAFKDFIDLMDPWVSNLSRINLSYHKDATCKICTTMAWISSIIKPLFAGSNKPEGTIQWTFLTSLVPISGFRKED